AQKVILDALEQQVGGAGVAEAGGLTGAANRLTDAWGNLLKAIGRTPQVSGIAQGALNLLARAVEEVTRAFEGEPIANRIVALNRRLIEAQDELAKLEGPGRPLLGGRLAVDDQRRQVEKLQRELDTLIGQARSEADTLAQEQSRADAGRRAAEAERLSGLLATRRAEIERSLEQLANDPGNQIAKINRELDETRRKLEALRAPDRSNAGDVDAALGRAEELARRRIEAIEEAARESAEKVGAANARVIEDLRRQMAGLDNERRAFIDKAVSRLSEGATEAQRAEVEKLAGALYDEKNAREALDKTMRSEARLREEGKRLVEEMRSPTEAYAASLEKLNTLLRAGAIDQETFNRALAKANTDLAEAQARVLRQSREWQDGFKRALGDYVDAASDAAKAAEKVTTLAFKGMEDALVSFVTTGKVEFSDLAKSIMADITRIAVRQAILGPLASMLNGGGGNLLGGLGQIFAGLFHEGGIVGNDNGRTRSVDADLFLGAPRFHTGGFVGLAPDEVPAILKRGEAVLTPGQMARLGERMRGDEPARPISLTMNISTPDANSFRYAQWQIAAEAVRALERARRNL
ncbi:MAG TPA: phage tail tape measure C-terminal domain-containing protein, partial [Beijerinckiaceae bacterium]|nr:phage tail tape measure C-terminal domain-containing protein [Beijerinckiaceae bacterium]